jgi:hypothetical protein
MRDPLAFEAQCTCGVVELRVSPNDAIGAARDHAARSHVDADVVLAIRANAPWVVGRIRAGKTVR